MNAQLLSAAFVVAVVFGAVVSRSGFCTLEAISGFAVDDRTGHLHAWLLAFAVALTGTAALEVLGLLSLESTLPPYRSVHFAWLRYLLGGLIFGAGLTLAKGCAYRNLVRICNGDARAVLVVLVTGGSAWLMVATDLYRSAIAPWMELGTVDLSVWGVKGQDLGSLAASALAMDAATSRMIIALVLAVAVLLVVCRRRGRRPRDSGLLVSGAVVGLCVLTGWYLTGGALGLEAVEEEGWLRYPPIEVGVQSYRFVAPTGDTLSWLAGSRQLHRITFGTVAVAGLVAGALIQSLASGGFRWRWFDSLADFLRHLLGAALMGVGGVLALGGTIGQGVSGLSTLSLGSFLAVAAMVTGCVLASRLMPRFQPN